MKKILSVAIALCSLATVSFAQTASPLKSQYSLSLDTVTNAGTKYLTSPAQKNAVRTAAVAFYATKISGVVAGTATLEASVDGTNWYGYYSSMATAYSYTLTDVASQTFRWDIADVHDLYFRVKVVGSGTMAAKISGSILPRP